MSRRIGIFEMPDARFVLRRTLAFLCAPERAKEISEHTERYVVIFHDPRLPGDFSVLGTNDEEEVLVLFSMLHFNASRDSVADFRYDVSAGPQIGDLLGKLAEELVTEYPAVSQRARLAEH